eukprot:GFKZ01010046.1.p1 GENE.GFKZ01010046.1~~GFKZ01010046.1.p1  ORF type:complete len:361 (+),score=39.94 GFKZ01010046.1:307-1389(+)
MPPVKHALLKIRILSAPHLRLRQVALRLLSLDRKHRLHPHLATLLTLHDAFEVRLQSFQLAFAHRAHHLPDDIFDLVLSELSRLPRVLSDITDGLNAIANVLSTPSFKGLPARYLNRLHAFCLHSRMALRTLDCVMALLRKAFPIELNHQDENDQVLRGLLDIISAPSHPNLQLTVDASPPEKTPTNHAPFYTAVISHAVTKGSTHDIAERLCGALGNNHVLSWVIDADNQSRRSPVDLKDVVLETADIGIFILTPEYLERDELMMELGRFVQRSREDQVNFSRRPIVIPLYCGIGQDDMRRERGDSWARELAAFDPMILRDGTERTVQNIATRIVSVWERFRSPTVKVTKGLPDHQAVR